MDGAIIGSAMTIVVGLFSFTWYLSGRLSNIDTRITLIERHLKINGNTRR